MPSIVACVTDAVYLLHNAISFSFVFVSLGLGTRGGATGWGTALPAGRQRVRFFIAIILPPHYDPEVDSASNRNGYQKYLLRGKGGRCVQLKPYHLHVTTVLISGSLNLLEPSGPVHVLLYLFSPPWIRKSNMRTYDVIVNFRGIICNELYSSFCFHTHWSVIMGAVSLFLHCIVWGKQILGIHILNAGSLLCSACMYRFAWRKLTI